MSHHRLRPLLALTAVAALLGACGGTDPGTEPVEGGAVTATDAAAPTEEATDDAADGADDGADDGAEDPGADEACAGREDEAFIHVSTPASGAAVTDGFEVAGCGNTFEATYLWRLEQDGAVVAQDVGTMTCGSGCVGTFAFTVTAGVTGDVTLVVYAESAEDGSEQHVVTLPLTIG